MRRLTCIVAAPVLVTALAISTAAADKKKGKPLSAGEVFKRSAPGIVAIDCLGNNGVKVGTASGFIVSDTGKIITNFHVIERCVSLLVRLTNGDAYDFTYVKEIDPRKDLALIRIHAASLKPLPLGESNDAEVGQTVFSIGNASGLQNTLQQGLVSAFRQDNGFRVMQVSASINLGNSGGPILDDQARVIAVAAAKVNGAENLGFAIPIDYAKGMLESNTETPFPAFAAAMKATLAKLGANNPNTTAAPSQPAQPSAPAPGGVLGGIITSQAPPPLVFTKIDAFAARIWKFEGDGMPARQVALGRLFGVACDRAGNIYASDAAAGAVVKIDTSGRLRILIGPNSPPGDRTVNPSGIAVDSAGAVYVTENGLRIRKIAPGGGVTTIAGGDKRGFTPDGAQAAGALLAGVFDVAVAADGTVLFSEWDSNRVRKIDSRGALQTVAGDGQARFAGDGGPAAQASLQHPRGLAFGSEGNLYIAEQAGGRVRKLARDGTISTVVGGGVTKDPVNCPAEVAVDSQGVLYVADPCRRHVLAVRNGQSSIFAGNGSGEFEPSGDGGPAVQASFDEWALAASPDNALIVSGPDYGHLYRITPAGVFSIIAGSGNWRAPVDGMQASEAYFQGRLHLAADTSGGIVVSDSRANRIYRIDNRGVVTRLAGSARSYYNGENKPGREAGLMEPMGVRVRPNGAIVFSERGNSNRIREITPDGKIHTLAGNGRREYSGDGGRAINASLNSPNGVCLDPSGAIYFADTENQRIRKITSDGLIQLVAGNGTRGFSGDGGPAERASFNTPVSVERGPDGSLYVGDAGNRRVRRISRNGVITTFAGDGIERSAGDGGPAVKASFVWPYNLAIGPDRALYVMDSNGAHVRRIDLSTGIITTVAGNGSRETSGDGGPPLAAALGNSEGFAIDANGNMYLGDSVLGLIRVIRATTAASGVSAAGKPPAPGGIIGGIIGAIPAAPPPPPPPPPQAQRAAAIQVSADRMEVFLRGKIGVWTQDDAKTILGAVRDQKHDSEGDALTFDTPATVFARVTLHFGPAGKLVSASFAPAQNVKWEAQLAYMKNKFPGDSFQLGQRGDNISYTFPQTRTAFTVQPDGTVVEMSIF